MILEQKSAETISLGAEQTIEMGIDPSDTAMLMVILSEGLYSDPIGSIVREWASNGLDAIREAGVDEPIIVSLKYDLGQTWFSVQDYGTGISPERMEKVVSKYAASSKRQSADQLGMFGLGLKSGLAYSDSFLLNTIFEGTEYQYIFYKGEYGTKIDLITSKETTERNGTIIKIALRKDYDRWEFISKIKQQLAYFEGVYFDALEISNDFTIISTEDWKYSEMSDTTALHLCLDNVYYQLDFTRLGIPSISTPIALNFSTRDGIRPTPNREQIMITPTVKELIIKKLKRVATSFVEEYNKKVDKFTSLIDIWHIPEDNKKVTIEGRDFIIDDLIEFSDVPAKEIEISSTGSVIDLKAVKKHPSYLLSNFKVVAKISNGTYSTKKAPEYDGAIFNSMLRGWHIILMEDSPSKLMIDYLKTAFSPALVVRLAGKRRLGALTTKNRGRSTYIEDAQLTNYPRRDWRQVIKDFQAIENELISRMKPLKSIEISAEWLEDRKNNRQKSWRTIVDKVEINPRFFSMTHSKSVLGKPELFSLENLRKSPTLVIYDLADRKDQLGKLYTVVYDNMTRRRNKVTLVRVAALCQRDYDKLEKNPIHNWIKYSKFMEGNSKVFGRFCTQHLLYEFKSNNHWLFDRVNLIEKFSSSLAEDIRGINTFIGDYYPRRTDSQVIDYMIEICSEKGLWDPIISQLENIKKYYRKFDFIKVLQLHKSNVNADSEEVLTICRDILKARKFKMDWHNYSSIEQLTGKVPEVPIEEEDDIF